MVTVTRALCKGHLVLNLPRFLLLFGIPVGVRLLQPEPLSGWSYLLVVFGCVVGIALSWLYWSYVAVKWQIWAFTNVEDIYELERKAERQLLVSPRGYQLVKGRRRHRLVKGRMATRKEKHRLAKINRQLGDLSPVDTSIIDDPDVPLQTILRHSLGHSAWGVAAGLLGITGGLVMFALPNNFLHGIAAILISIVCAWRNYKTVNDRSPQITIDDRGITVRDWEFHAWERIRGEHIRSEGYGDHIESYLAYNYLTKEGQKVVSRCKTRIDLYDIPSCGLEHLLKVYRGRYNAKIAARENGGRISSLVQDVR